MAEEGLQVDHTTIPGRVQQGRSVVTHRRLKSPWSQLLEGSKRVDKKVSPPRVSRDTFSLINGLRLKRCRQSWLSALAWRCCRDGTCHLSIQK